MRDRETEKEREGKIEAQKVKKLVGITTHLYLERVGMAKSRNVHSVICTICYEFVIGLKLIRAG